MLRSVGVGVSCGFRILAEQNRIPSVSAVYDLQVRHKYTFISSKSAASLWKSVTSVSDRARQSGKKVKRSRNLNMGQRIGTGVVKTVLPGLNAPIVNFRERRLNEQEYRPPDKEFHQRLVETRDKLFKDKKPPKTRKVDTYDRGYSGPWLLGRKLGPPDPVGEETFEGFQTVCLEQKFVCQGSPKGRLRKSWTLVACGNGNGLVGYAYVKGQNARLTPKMAVNRAGKRLNFVERLDERTIYQDFYAECNRTRIWARRASRDYGLHCHHVIRDLCMLAGIKDLQVKVEGGARNYLAIAKAFLTGLRNQETFQQLAERKRLHVVEFSKEHGYIPKVVATPKNAPLRADKDLDRHEVLDVEELYSQGRTPYAKPPKPAFFYGTPEFISKRWKDWRYRNMEDVSIRLTAEGEVKVFSWPERRAWGEREHEKVRRGEKLIPMGLGLSEVDRTSFEDEEEA